MADMNALSEMVDISNTFLRDVRLFYDDDVTSISVFLNNVPLSC